MSNQFCRRRRSRGTSQNQKLVSSVDVFVPNPSDIVCGRGKGIYNRPGNRDMLSVIRNHLPDYQACQSKPAKSAMLVEIRDKLMSQGRKFVKKDKDGQWVIMGTKEAKEKIGHAMREAIAPSHKIKTTTTTAVKKAKNCVKRGGRTFQKPKQLEAAKSTRADATRMNVSTVSSVTPLRESLVLSLQNRRSGNLNLQLMDDLMSQDLLSSELTISGDFMAEPKPLPVPSGSTPSIISEDWLHNVPLDDIWQQMEPSWIFSS